MRFCYVSLISRQQMKIRNKELEFKKLNHTFHNRLRVTKVYIVFFYQLFQSDLESQTKISAQVTACCEICALLRHYAVQSGNSSLMFCDNLKKGLIGCTELSVRNYHSTLHNIPEERFPVEA